MLRCDPCDVPAQAGVMWWGWSSRHTQHACNGATQGQGDEGAADQDKDGHGAYLVRCGADVWIIVYVVVMWIVCFTYYCITRGLFTHLL